MPSSATHHFVDHRNHHPGDDFIVREVTFWLANPGQQAIHRRIFFFLRFAFAVFFIAPEAQTVFLTKAVGVKQGVNRIAIIFLHALWEARRHNRLRVMRGINANHIQQIRRPIGQPNCFSITLSTLRKSAPSRSSWLKPAK